VNKVILMGHLTRDVEMRQTPSGVSLARFSIAVRRRCGKGAQQQADFINCVAWRQTAEFIAKYFRNGSMIATVGQLRTGKYDKDGRTVYTTAISVDEAYFTGESHDTAQSAAEPTAGRDDFEMIAYDDNVPF